MKTDDGQITTHDRIRQMLDRNYKKICWKYDEKIQ
jgi:hypothetical protein